MTMKFYLFPLLFLLVVDTMNAQLNWNIKTDLVENSSDINTFAHYLEEITYTKNQKMVWTVEAPTPFLTIPFANHPKKTDYNQGQKKLPFLLGNIVETSSFFVIPLKTALLVVDKNNGQLIEDISYDLMPASLNIPYRDIFWFDDGTYTTKCKNKETNHGAQYEATFCLIEGKYILHFNGKHLYILSKKTGNLIDKVAIQKTWEKKAKVFASTQWKNLSVHWDGIIYR